METPQVGKGSAVKGKGGRLAAFGRYMLPAAWLLATVGCYAPWITHWTAALTLAGPDLAEFVKFLPAVADGTLGVHRHAFYLPIVAVILGVALLVGSPGLRYPTPVRAGAVLLSIPLSTQLLPPAWSPAGLFTREFLLQPVALAFCWLALTSFPLLGRLPLRWTGPVMALLSLIAALLPAQQLAAVKPHLDAVYGRPPALGWGLALSVAGLLLAAIAAMAVALARGKAKARMAMTGEKRR